MGQPEKFGCIYDMGEEKEITMYATYNGLNRPAMFKGIPLMPLLVLAFVGVFGTLLFAFIFGPKGLVFTAIIFLIGFVLKLICENDPRALEVHKMELKGAFINIRQNINVIGKDSIVGFDSTGIKK